MLCYGSKELAFGSRTVRNNTIIIATEIPEEKFGFRPAPECRSVAQLLAHIAVSYQFQYQMHAIDKRDSYEGIDFPSLIARVMQEEAKPRSKAQIIDLLKEEGEKWALWVGGLSEEFLSQIVKMPEGATPAAKSRFEMILSVKEHEMHHRGQLMLMERLLGIVPHLTREREERMRQSRWDLAAGAFARLYLCEWIDEPIPAMSDRTPREAAGDADLRPKLVDLIRGLEGRCQLSLKEGTPAYDPSRIWVELGLAENSMPAHPHALSRALL